jgi:hypothetical protein
MSDGPGTTENLLLFAALLAIAAPALIAPPIAAHADEAPCGVRMPVTMRSAFDKKIINLNDVFVADGELVEEDGHHSCIAVTIECYKKTNVCMMVDVPVQKIMGQWEIVSITPQMDIPISTWNDHFIISVGQSAVCLRREITIDIVRQRIRIVETNSCYTSISAATYYIQPPQISGKAGN